MPTLREKFQEVKEVEERLKRGEDMPAWGDDSP